FALEPIAIGVLARHSNQIAPRVKGPCMIGTLEGLRVPEFLAANHGAAVSAGVKENSYLAVITAHQNQRTTRDVARLIVSGVRNFRFVADIDPALVEDAPPFIFEARGIGKGAAIHLKQSR